NVWIGEHVFGTLVCCQRAGIDTQIAATADVAGALPPVSRSPAWIEIAVGNKLSTLVLQVNSNVRFAHETDADDANANSHAENSFDSIDLATAKELFFT